MTPIDPNPATSDEHRFDLLVDGELSETARRELLSRLDDEPGGWRGCALAFLEAQSWRQAFGAVVARPSADLPPRRPARWFRLGGPAGTLLAMAASFLLALLLGGLVQAIRNPATLNGGPESRPLAEHGARKASIDRGGPAERRPPDAAGQPESVPPKLWVVELPAAAGPEGEGQTIRLPAFEGDRLSENWLEGRPASLSPELLQQLQKVGLRVEQRRKLLPWRMKDGRRLVVPVDEVDLHYVGNPTL